MIARLIARKVAEQMPLPKERVGRLESMKSTRRRNARRNGTAAPVSYKPLSQIIAESDLP